METIKTICLALISVLSIFFCGLILLCGILAMLHRVVQAMLPADYAVRHRYLSIGITFLLFGLLCLFVVYPFAEHIKRGYEAWSLEEKQTSETTKMQVFTADTITIQEKYISGDGLFTDGNCFLVLTDGKETVRLKVTESIYDKYKVGDIYEHDADPKEYREH